MASNLSPYELYKRDFRLPLFLRKFKQEESFELLDGSSIILVYSPEIEDMLITKHPSISGPIFWGINGKKYRLSDLRKTADFGGKGAGFGTRIEDAQVAHLNIQLEQIKSEIKMPIVPIEVSNTVYEICTTESTFGTPKSDFHFINKAKQEVVWISHKDGKTPMDFQQYDGMTHYTSHSEIMDFIETIKQKYPNGLNPGHTIGRKIEDKNLQCKAIYGYNFGLEYGRQNVNVMVQGNINLISDGTSYKIQANKVHYNGELLQNEYEPIMVACFRTDRNQFGLQHSRFMILPIGSRRISEFI